MPDEALLRSCPKCKSAMETGFMLESDERGRHIAQWVQGTPERGFLGGLKTGQRDRRNVLAMRCTRCGFLELDRKSVV